MSQKSGWNHGCDPPSQVPLGKSTHIEIRDVGGTFFVSFNGVVQCTIDYIGRVLHARTDRDVYVSDPWHTASDVTFVFSKSSYVFSCERCSMPRFRFLFGQWVIRSDRLRLDVVFHRFVCMFTAGVD